MMKSVLRHIETWITREGIADYLRGIFEFKSFNRFQNKHLLLKTYLNAKQIPLSLQEQMHGHSFNEVIERRRSITRFKPEKGTIDQVSQILRSAFFINDKEKLLSTSPSAGGLFSTEVYLAALNISGLETGLYHYNVESFCLEHIKFISLEHIREVFVDENVDFENAHGVFVFTTKCELPIKKYKYRAWRILYLEVGHFMMNFWLSVFNTNLAGSSLAGGLDQSANHLLEIDGFREHYMSGLVFGNPLKN